MYREREIAGEMVRFHGGFYTQPTSSVAGLLRLGFRRDITAGHGQ